MSRKILLHSIFRQTLIEPFQIGPRKKFGKLVPGSIQNHTIPTDWFYLELLSKLVRNY